MSSSSKPIGRGRRGLTESWRQSAQRNLDFISAEPARLVMTQLADYFIPALRFDFIRYETARSGGTTNLNAIGNEGLLKLSKRLEAAGRPKGPILSGRQSSPISTAIRIRSEWLFAPSFCLSNEVVLATVL